MLFEEKMDEASKPLMAFTLGLLGFYKCVHMLFRLLNAPATFQRLIKTCLGDPQLNWCLIYLDDIIVFSKTPKYYLVWLKAVFQKLKDVGLKLKPSKCEFLAQLKAFSCPIPITLLYSSVSSALSALLWTGVNKLLSFGVC